MSGSLDRHQLEEALIALSAESQPRDDCPPAEALWDAARGQGEAHERRAVIDHMATCASCSEDWRLAVELAPEEQAEAKVLTSSAWQRFKPLALAAGVILAVALGLLVWEPSAPPIERGGDSWLEAVTGEGPVARADALLEWTPGPEGSRYQVTVSTEALELVTTVEGLEEPRLQLGEAELAALPPSTVLLWRVEAELPDGTLHTSKTFRTRLE